MSKDWLPKVDISDSPFTRPKEYGLNPFIGGSVEIIEILMVYIYSFFFRLYA